ncbi:MAG: hypothetical protein Q4G16_12510, partial [Cruoricaptor ignavus]|nr:hypothetical protein [Cruoricaptor ignavus]
MDFRGKKILFISASFFSYEKAITKRLQELGAEVDFYDERPSNSVLAKGLIRVNPKFYQWKINAYYRKILQEIKGKHYDFFLLIKGEAVPFFFLEELKRSHPKTQKIFYAYDSSAEYPKFRELFSFFDASYTFEPNDAKNFQLHFRPLFFIKDYIKHTENKQNIDLLFVGTAHTDRYIIGNKVEQKCQEINLKSYFYYYAPGKIAFLLKRIFDKTMQTFDLKKISFQKLSHLEIAELYQQTNAVLDINKPFQYGLTMRTFEALASGRKIVTTNSDIRYYPFFNPNNILIINRENPQIDKRFFDTEFQNIPNQHLGKMTLDSWLEALFIKPQDDYWTF